MSPVEAEQAAKARAMSAVLARYLPLFVAAAGLLLSVLLGVSLRTVERRHDDEVLAAETAAIERTLRVGLEQRSRALRRMARRWELSGGRGRADFELEAGVNIESYPAFRSLGWVDGALVVRWVHPIEGNEAAIGFDNSAEPRRLAALLAARRSGRSILAGPVDLRQGGSALLLFQPIAAVDARPQGYIYAAIDHRRLLRRVLGDTAPAYAVQVSLAGKPVFSRAPLGRAGRDVGASPGVAAFEFGGVPWRIEVRPPPRRLDLAQVVPVITALLSLAFAAATRFVLRGQARALSLRREVRAGEDRFRTMTDAVPGLLFVADASGANVHTNVGFQHYTGLTAGELMGHGWMAALHPEDRSRAADVWGRATAGGTSYEADYRFRRHDGEYRWFLVRGLPSRGDAGIIESWFGVCTDIHDLRIAEGELRDGEARLRAIVDTAVDAIVVIDEGGSVVSANPATRRVFGFAPDELIGGNISKLMDASHAGGHDGYLANYMVSGQRKIIGVGREVEGRRKDGSVFPLDLSIAEWRDAGGRRYFTGIMRDVSERRQAAEALASSERRFRTLADAMPALVYTARDRRNTYVNGRYAEYTGLTAEELMGDGWLRIVHPDDVALLGARGATAREGHDALAIELRLRRADGSWRWHLGRGLRDRNDPELWVGAMVDIHDRREAEARLAASESLLAAVLDALPVGVIIADADGRIVRDNAANRELWGVPPETTSWAQYGEWVGYHPETGERIKADEWAMSRALLYGETVTGELVQNQRFGSGERRFYLNSAAPVRDSSGAIVAGVVAELDVTDRLEAEAEVHRLNRDLERRVEERTQRLAEVNAELQAFAYSVSHDLRAPLRAMQGFGHALAEDYGDRLDDLGRDYLGRIIAGAKQMDALILDLLAYSRLSREELVLAPVPLERVVDAALDQIARTLRERHATIEVLRPMPVVLGHSAVLTQVIANLVVNASKFVAAGTTAWVRLRSEARGRRVRLWVEDNGIGIAPEHRDRIFEVFQRLHAAAEYPGTGIGLAIVRKGVERLGGTVGVESTPGQGSRFWIELSHGDEGAAH